MKLYRTPNGRWAGTQADARALCTADNFAPSAFELVDVPTDKAGLIDYLNGYGTGVSTRIADPVADLVGSKADERSIEETFEDLPLPMQLHLAALAVENARDQIKPRKEG